MATTYTQRTYTKSGRTESLLKALQEHLAAMPENYDSQWAQQLDDTLMHILQQPEFSYNPNEDPLYNQFRESYVNQGRMAMMDTLGQAATLTGGYGNSYAQLAGQQAYQGYLQGLNDVMPELYQLALETYDRRSQNLLNRYGALADREAMDYGRYQDNYGLWADERDFLADQYDTQQGFDYTQFRDMVGDDQWMAQFQEDVRRFDFQHKLGEFAHLASSGGGGSAGTTTRGSKKRKDEEEKEKNQTYPSKIVVPNRTKPHLYTDESY